VASVVVGATLVRIKTELKRESVEFWIAKLMPSVSFSYKMILNVNGGKRKGLWLFGLVVVCRGDDPIVCARTRLTLSTILIDILRLPFIFARSSTTVKANKILFYFERCSC
jgi:hypothetical protein